MSQSEQVGLSFAVESTLGGAVTEIDVAPSELIVAGWAGRDQDAIEHHIRELEAIGVRRPRCVPLFYRLSASLLTTGPAIQVVGDDSSGEAEAVLIKHGDDLLVGIGSDHTDRKVEAYGVTVSKQICAKPLSAKLWRFDDVAPHWDQLILRSYVFKNGQRSLYQEGPMSGLRNPLELIELYEKDAGPFRSGMAMLCGTVPVHGGFQPSKRFELELHDPVLNRSLVHGYAVNNLPIAD
ncbi:DUF2848 domain-containing protein [Tardiphaga sp.]|uniref:DUF2848 domain-containing protein n=1 Tax=Tardiphaga sp. TaxID=1926292 RepID=UPI0037DA4F79